MKEYKVLKIRHYAEDVAKLEQYLNAGWIIQRADRDNDCNLLYVLERTIKK